MDTGNKTNPELSVKTPQVLPSEPAAAHADAGKLLFSLDTKVDTSRTVGFRSRHVYCVAPIADYATTSTIQYWAVGVDCCQGRSQFACGDVTDSKARSGLVVFDNRGFFPSQMHFFQQAAKQAAAEYGVVSARDAIFVEWTRDATALQNRLEFFGQNFFGKRIFVVIFLFGGRQKVLSLCLSVVGFRTLAGSFRGLLCRYRGRFP